MRFRQKLEHVTAWQWDGAANSPSEEFRGMGAAKARGRLVVGEEKIELSPGHWLVKLGDGRVTVMTDENFKAAYEPAE